MYYRIIYIFFLVSAVVFGSVYLGPISLRQMFALIMLILCLKETKNFWMDKSFKFFLLFSFFCGLTSLLYGYESDFLKMFIAYYIVAWIALWSTFITCKNGNTMDCIHTLVCIGFFDAVITIMQSFGNPIALGVGMMFAPEEVEKMSASIFQGDLINSAIMGIFGAVYNGYFLMLSSILSLIYIMKYKHVVRFVPFFICFLASFLCQQRSPFFINVLFLVFFLFKYIRHLSFSHKMILLVLSVLVFIYLFPMFVDYSNQNDMRYSSVGIDGTGREDIYKHAIKYIESNLFLANIFDFRNRFGYSPHMLFYNMIIYGGLGGFVCVVVALSIHIKASIIAIFKPLCVENLISFFSAGALLAFTANSFTHNASIVSGDMVIWTLWAVLFASLKKSF